MAAPPWSNDGFAQQADLVPNTLLIQTYILLFRLLYILLRTELMMILIYEDYEKLMLCSKTKNVETECKSTI